MLADIRDVDGAATRSSTTHRPEIVFHAAALKHLPMLERFPDEGWKTNVLGTLNVLRLTADHDVEHFVNISTDKAADATSVLGSTKRIAEQLTAWYAEQTGRRYISVRFGNVLGSRGSMLHTFNAQIAHGGPITVTHPDVTRYFMTIPEACELVVQAGAIGRPGEVMVLEMGEPVKILDVARRMIDAVPSAPTSRSCSPACDPGEKLHEVLFGEDERIQPTTDHPMIRSVRVPPWTRPSCRTPCLNPRRPRPPSPNPTFAPIDRKTPVLLSDYVRAIKRGWVILLVTLAVALVLAAGVVFRKADTYTASTQLFVSAAVTDGDPEQVYQRNLIAAQRVTSYVSVVSGDVVQQRVSEELGSDVDASVAVSIVPDTVIMNISVTGADADRVTEIARAYAEVVPSVIDEVEAVDESAPQLRVTVIDEADVPGAPDPKAVLPTFILAAILGLGLGFVLVVAREVLRRERAETTPEAEGPARP